MKQQYLTYISILASLLLSFSAYVDTLAPSLIQFGDSPKFQFIGLVNGIPHQTGYPLYLLVSNLVLFVTPFDDIAFSINLMSAWFAMLTILLINIIIIKLTDSPIIGLIMALTVAFSHTFWSQAIIAEVYTFNTFFIALIIWLVLLWETTNQDRYFYFAWATVCIGLGNHATLIFFAIGLIIYLITTSTFLLKTRRFWGITLSLSTLTLGQYLYLFWLAQSPIYSELPSNSWPDFLFYISGGGFQRRFFAVDLFTGFGAYQYTLIKEFTILIVILASIGAFALHTRPKILLYLLVSLGASLLFTVTYNIQDIINYYLPSYLVLSILAGVGLKNIIDKFDQITLTYVVKPAQLMMIGCVACLPFYLFHANAPILGDWFLETQNTTNLKRQLLMIPAGSTLFTPANRDWWRALYLKFAEGYLPDNHIVKEEDELPPAQAVYAVKPDFRPEDYEIEIIHLGEPLFSVLDSGNDDDTILFVSTYMDQQQLPPRLVTLFDHSGILDQDGGVKQNVLVLMKKNGGAALVEIGDSGFSLETGQTIKEFVSPVNLELFLEIDEQIEVLTLKIEGQTVLNTQDFGLVIINSQTGDIIDAGPISRDDLLFDDVLLYKIERRNAP